MGIKKSFTECTLSYLEKTFGLVQQFECVELDNWLKRPIALSEQEQMELRSFQDLLRLNVMHWNEQELSLNFIGPLFAMVKFTTRQFNFFAQRLLSAEIDGITLHGLPDGLIASGYREPEIPFFAFHEYKREIANQGEPAAQVLAAMLACQALNQDHKIIYGCYVLGRDWYFMALNGKDYCISQDFSAVTNDIFSIFRALKALKELVGERVGI